MFSSPQFLFPSLALVILPLPSFTSFYLRPLPRSLAHSPSPGAPRTLFVDVSLHLTFCPLSLPRRLPVRKVQVWLGAHDVSLQEEEGRVVRGVTHAILHEGFDSRDLSNDVALLRLDEAVAMSRTVRPVCLPDVRE